MIIFKAAFPRGIAYDLGNYLHNNGILPPKNIYEAAHYFMHLPSYNDSEKRQWPFPSYSFKEITIVYTP